MVTLPGYDEWKTTPPNCFDPEPEEIDEDEERIESLLTGEYEVEIAEEDED